MLLWLFRSAYVALLVGMALFAINHFLDAGETLNAVSVPLGILAIGGLVLFTDMREKQKQITTLSAIYFGLLMGLLLGWLFWIVLEPVFTATLGNKRDIIRLIQIAISVMCCYVTISTLIQTKDEFRFIIPYVEFSKQMKGGRPLLLDTSVIIDGRIADVCDTRLIDAQLLVPRFVLQELQAIADSGDRLKRNRGRRGLDVLKRLQSNPKIDLEMHDGTHPELRGGERIRVDERLVLLAKALGARVVTNDFNLNKIAQLQGVDVINLNEISNALKTVALPGEFLNVRVVKAGDQPLQGVGYLDDGTMVVIEQGRNLIGQEVSIVVTSMLQTQAGRMIFGRPDQRSSGSFTPYPAAVGQPGANPAPTSEGDGSKIQNPGKG